jgi:hypothetical protein
MTAQPPATVDPLAAPSGADLPEAFNALDADADRARKATSRLAGAELALLVLAAAAGIASWRVGRHHLDVVAAIGAAAFAGAIAAAYARRVAGTEQRWVQARGGAETVKSAAWSYAVAGDPLGLGHTDPDGVLLDHVTAALVEAPPLPSPNPTAVHITAWMRTVRAAATTDRRALYTSHRLDDQIGFYSRRARFHARAARRWASVTVVANVAGVAAGLTRFLDHLDIDLVGVAAAVAGGAVAWSQLHQSRTLAATYGAAARQLAVARDRLPSTADADWAGFVRATEELMARERTVWLLDRGAGRR